MGFFGAAVTATVIFEDSFVVFAPGEAEWVWGPTSLAHAIGPKMGPIWTATTLVTF